jgi:hypothetical protein
MSLSVCVKNVKVTSLGGNISSGPMKCEDIDILASKGFTIEYLDEQQQPDSTASSFEPIQEIEQIVEPIIEELPIEAETIQVVKPIYAIYQQDIFDRSLELATANVNLEAEKQQLATQVQTLQNTLEGLQTDVSQMPFANQKEYHEFLLEKQIDKIHSMISLAKNYVGNHPRPEGREIEFSKWVNLVESEEVKLEEFARNLGLNYSRRSKVDGEPFYYNRYERELDPIYRDDWVSYIPTSSATVRTKF